MQLARDDIIDKSQKGPSSLGYFVRVALNFVTGNPPKFEIRYLKSSPGCGKNNNNIILNKSLAVGFADYSPVTPTYTA